MSSNPALPHHLPWWIGLFLVLVWIAVVAGIVLLARRIRGRARRRDLAQRRATGGDRVALGPGRAEWPDGDERGADADKG